MQTHTALFRLFILEEMQSIPSLGALPAKTSNPSIYRATQRTARRIFIQDKTK